MGGAFYHLGINCTCHFKSSLSDFNLSIVQGPEITAIEYPNEYLIDSQIEYLNGYPNEYPNEYPNDSQIEYLNEYPNDSQNECKIII